MIVKNGMVAQRLRGLTNFKGQISTGSLISHIILWVVISGIGIWLVYSATHTNTENNKYAPGATVSDNHSSRWPLTMDFNFSCVNQGLQDKWGGKKIVNSTR